VLLISYARRPVMNKMVTYLAIALFISCTTLFACSKNEDVGSEKGKIEKMTDRTAEVIVNKIKTPIDRARSVKDMEKERMRGIDETLKE
jgi:hypothetical protein